MAVFLVTWDLNKQKANYDQARLNLINHLSRYRIVFTSTNVKGEVRPRPKWEKWKNKFELLEFAEDPRAQEQAEYERYLRFPASQTKNQGLR
jgi:hypothetical protein